MGDIVFNLQLVDQSGEIVEHRAEPLLIDRLGGRVVKMFVLRAAGLSLNPLCHPRGDVFQVELYQLLKN